MGIERAFFDKLRMMRSRPLPSNTEESFLIQVFAFLSPG
jgi:hypothetical protein